LVLSVSATVGTEPLIVRRTRDGPMFLFSKDERTLLTDFGRFCEKHFFEVLNEHCGIDSSVAHKQLTLGIFNLDLHYYLNLIIN
jgi:hypothetical protein